MFTKTLIMQPMFSFCVFISVFRSTQFSSWT